MNFLSRLFGAPEQRSTTLASPSPDLLALFGAVATSAGIVVNADTAMRSPTALAAIRAISETAGMLPIAVRTKTGDGWRKVSDHPAAKVLNGFCNPWTSSEQLRTQLTIDAILHRNGGLAQVVRVNGEIRELHRIWPSAVTIETTATGEPLYKLSLAAGGTQTLRYSDVIHVTVPGWSIDRPICLIDLAKEAIALDLLMIGQQSKTFANGGLPRIILSPESDTITVDAIKNALAFLHKQAVANTGEPIVLPATFKEAFRTIGFGEMQFLELRRLVIEDIARALRVPATIIGDLTKGTYSNTEQMGRQFLQLCLLPWLEMWESALTRCLVVPEDRATVELEFITEDLLRGDFATRMAGYRSAGGGAHLTVNEIRALDGYPPHPDGNGLMKQAGQTDAPGKPADAVKTLEATEEPA
ncbi:MAG TPA: phage portal protein [Devosiaceae bacterium]|jgi:HK97 family phage portal protein